MDQPSIGILAGMGPCSTAPFIDLVVTECQLQYGARDIMGHICGMSRGQVTSVLAYALE